MEDQVLGPPYPIGGCDFTVTLGALSDSVMGNAKKWAQLIITSEAECCS